MTDSDDPGEEVAVLRGKTILLISPQPWDHLFISKHHYAQELAKDNRVYFLEPPSRSGRAGVTIRPSPVAPALTIVSWRPGFPRWLRFHAYALYRRLVRRDAHAIVRAIGCAPDIVWSFDFNLFPDLGAFGAPIRIFHPVDPLTSSRQIEIGLSADLIVSVSDRILANFSEERFSGRTLLVNHGLAEAFADLARRPAAPPTGEEINVGYFGNLNRAIINLDLLGRLAEENPAVTFHFWGPCAGDGPFAAALSGLPNVRIHGERAKDALAAEIAAMDLFVLPYVHHEVESDRSNSHKLLEYMSTGRLTIASPMDCYADRPELLRMPARDDDDAFCDLFRSTLNSIHELNAPEMVRRRKDFALQHTYSKNVATIDCALAGRAARSGAVMKGSTRAVQFAP